MKLNCDMGEGFGRRKIDISPHDIEQLILYQAAALAAYCHAEGGELGYIKPGEFPLFLGLAE